MDDRDHGDHPKLKPAVVLTGSAKNCSGTPNGLLDIGVNENAFFFRVALSGTRSNRSKVNFEIEQDGTVHIRGMVTEGTKLLQQSSSMCKLRFQQMSSTGLFTLSFSLPGPVDPRLVSPSLSPEGILEVVVMRYKGPSDPTNGSVLPS